MPTTASAPQVLLIAPRYPRAGDAERSGLTVYAQLAAAALRDAGATVQVLAFLERDRASPEPSIEEQVTVHRRHLGWIPIVSRLAPNLITGVRLLREVRRIGHHRDFAAIEAPNMEGIAWALAWRLPNLWLRLHSPMWEGFAQGGRPASYRDAWVRRLDRITARRAANLVTHSAAHAEAMRRELRLGDRRIHLVPHGIVDPGLTPEVGRIPGRLLAIGPLWPRKGADVLLEAFVAVVRQHPHASLTMVGPTPDPAVRSQLEGLRAAHPALAGRVVLTGRLDERHLEREWRAAEVVVMASRYESFGLVAVEAMARGVPLVTSQAGSLPEVTGDAALHATTGDPGELAVRIAELLGDATLRRHLATLGRQRYLHSFTRADMGARLLATFTNLPDHA